MHTARRLGAHEGWAGEGAGISEGKGKSLNGTWITRLHRQLLQLRLYRISGISFCVSVCVWVFFIEYNQIAELDTLMSLFHMSPRCVCVWLFVVSFSHNRVCSRHAVHPTLLAIKYTHTPTHTRTLAHTPFTDSIESHLLLLAVS